METIRKSHENAAGVAFKKDQLNNIITKCNEMMPVENLTTVHTVDWEIPASSLKREYVQEVAENYAVFGSTVPEPLFAITNININASQIAGYGDNNSFIRFVYNGIVFVKKYCSKDDFDLMTLKDRRIIGANNKELQINVIAQFVLNSWEDKVSPEVKIVAFDSQEVEGKDSDDWVEPIKPKKPIDDDDFDW